MGESGDRTVDLSTGSLERDRRTTGHTTYEQAVAVSELGIESE